MPAWLTIGALVTTVAALYVSFNTVRAVAARAADDRRLDLPDQSDPRHLAAVPARAVRSSDAELHRQLQDQIAHRRVAEARAAESRAQVAELEAKLIELEQKLLTALRERNELFLSGSSQLGVTVGAQFPRRPRPARTELAS